MSSENSKLPRRIALVDCNNFYASCERVFQPSWEKRPVAVLSNNDGCIIARSQEIKDMGIPMGAPYFKVKEALREHKAVVVSSNYALYGDMSARVMRVLGDWAPHIEVYSIDECWVDLTGYPGGEQCLEECSLVQKVRQYTGIPVSMGIGPTKVLAKLANRIVKVRKVPSGVLEVKIDAGLEAILGDYPVEELWGIGRRWGSKLKALGIHHARDLRDWDPKQARRVFNVLMERIVLELRGVTCMDWEDQMPKKQIIASRSFGRPVQGLEELEGAVTFHVSRAAEKLRSQASEANRVHVFIQTSRFREADRQYYPHVSAALTMPSADTALLLKAAIAGLRRCYRSGYNYSKAGVMLSEISPVNPRQGDLFCDGDSDRRQVLMAVLDRVNRTYGRGTLRLGSWGNTEAWGMKQTAKTRAYTTRWSELPGVG